MNSVALEHTIDRATGKASYYMAGGTPPGTWTGNGTLGLGLAAGKQVKEDQLIALFGDGVHPVTGASLGRKFNTVVPLEQRVVARVAEAAIDPQNAALTQAEFEELSLQIRDEEMNRAERQSVSGFEFVFSPPKSVSSWWALADPELKDQIRQAHQAAIDATVEKLETDIVRTRIGTDGAAQAHVKGISAALFDHWDTRDGDPQLHTHMLVSNRVQGKDRRWRTIDSRWSLMPAVATAGVFYDSVLMDELSARFGVEWTTQDVLEHPQKYQTWLTSVKRVDTVSARHQFALDNGSGVANVKWQIAGIPNALNQEFSTRSEQIRAKKDDLIAAYVQKHGQMPTNKQIIRMRQTATLRTRKAKQHRSLKDLTQSWRDRATRIVGDSFLFADRTATAGKQRLLDYPLWSFRNDDVDDTATREAAEMVLASLATTRSTWGRRNAEAAALRAIAGWRFRSAVDRDQAAGRIVALVLASAIALTPKNVNHTPRRFRTADNEDMFHTEVRDLFTTAEVWDAEERLLEAGRRTDSVHVDAATVESLLYTATATDARILSTDQVAAVQQLVTSGRAVDVLVGPAGAGKTTSLEKLREIWEHQHGAGSVRGLAPSAAAAEVLSESLGINTENTAKWLHETARGTHTLDGVNYQLQSGELLIVDEASMAGTLALDTLRAQAEKAGAKLLLVGDWAQLTAVDAGGAFGLLANDRPDVAELDQLHRFAVDWEADASKLLRLGKTTGLAPYLEHDRISWGLSETIIHDAVDAWKTDEATSDGTGDKTLTSMLIAPTNDIVDQLNDIARAWRIEQGHVDATQTVTLSAGVASPGDRIVTQQNARTLRTDHGRWVKNNDEWEVVSITEAGDIVASSNEETVVLPASYCGSHVRLAYATTAHRAQGRTVDTAHTIVDSSATRETFYVAMTRGKKLNRAYVVADEQEALGDPMSHAMSRTWRETLDQVVLSRGGDLSAHDTLFEEAERIGSIRQLAAEYQTLIADQLEREYMPTLADLDLITSETFDSPYLGPVFANLRRVDSNGADVPETIIQLLQKRELGDARDVLAVLHYRLEAHLRDGKPGTALHIAGLIEPAPQITDPDIVHALRDREHAIQLRAELIVDRAVANREPWLEELGVPIFGSEEAWRKRAVTVACYRDLYGETDTTALGREHAPARNRERDRHIAQAALVTETANREAAQVTVSLTAKSHPAIPL